MKILILDDREDGRYLLEILLRGNGYEVESVSNGSIALDKLKTDRFDLIISDILMPVMDGFQFCHKVKTEETLRDIPFIFYTATYTGPKDEEFAVKIGANRFIRKPCEPDEFMSTIQEVLKTAGQLKTSASETLPIPEKEVLQLYSERLVRKLEQKMLEAEADARALQSEKKKFQVLADELPLGMTLIGSDGSFRYLNPRFAELFGYSLTDLPNVKIWFEKAYPDSNYREKEIALWQRAQQFGHSSIPDPWTVQIKCFDGSVKQVRIRPAFLATGDQLVTYEDVSEQIRMEAKLRQAQKMEAIAALASGIAHDFNNILTAVMGYAEMAEQKIQQGSIIADYISGILQAAHRAKQLAGHILAFSRQSERERIPLALHLVVKEVLSLLRSTLPATIEIRQNADIDGVVFADPTQMHQVLMNLCTNAFHAMRKKGGILEIDLKKATLTTAEAALIPGLTSGLYLQLTVKDTGSGMTPDIMSRIFDPYFTTKPEGEGTGLGLSVTHEIVKSYHGAINVASIPGEGTTFHVYLPGMEHAAEHPPKFDQKILPQGSERVLYVDDESVLAALAGKMLEMLGYAVVTKISAIEALALFKSDPQAFDLVITDLTMPHMTGVALAKELRQIRPDLPIIICSGNSSPDEEQEAFGSGFQGFLRKPYTRHKLAALVRQVLDDRQKNS